MHGPAFRSDQAFSKKLNFLRLGGWGEAVCQGMLLHAYHASLSEVTIIRRLSIDAGITKYS